MTDKPNFIKQGIIDALDSANRFGYHHPDSAGILAVAILVTSTGICVATASLIDTDGSPEPTTESALPNDLSESDIHTQIDPEHPFFAHPDLHTSVILVASQISRIDFLEPAWSDRFNHLNPSQQALLQHIKINILIVNQDTAQADINTAWKHPDVISLVTAPLTQGFSSTFNAPINANSFTYQELENEPAGQAALTAYWERELPRMLSIETYAASEAIANGSTNDTLRADMAALYPKYLEQVGKELPLLYVVWVNPDFEDP